MVKVKIIVRERMRSRPTDHKMYDYEAQANVGPYGRYVQVASGIAAYDWLAESRAEDEARAYLVAQKPALQPVVNKTIDIEV